MIQFIFAANHNLFQLESTQCQIDVVHIQKAKDPQNLGTPPLTGWIETKVPDMWDRTTWPNYSGSAWYQIEWNYHCKDENKTTVPLALSISKISMAGAVFINNELVWKDSSLIEPLSRSWNQPRYFILVPSTLKLGKNVLLVHVIGIAYQSPGIGNVQFGSAHQIIHDHNILKWKVRTLTFINILMSLTFGAIVFIFWLFNRKDTALGWFVLASFCWGIFIANALMDSPFPFSDSETLARYNEIFGTLNNLFFLLFTWRFSDKVFKKNRKNTLAL